MKGGSSNRCQHTAAAFQMQLKNPAMDYFLTPSGDSSTVRTSLVTGKLKRSLIPNSFSPPLPAEPIFTFRGII